MRRPARGLALAGAATAVLALAGCDFAARSPGEKLWRGRCASCHGLDARGNTPQFMGNERADLTDDSWSSFSGDDAGLEAAIREGVFAQMPANPDLSRTELRELIAHLRKLRGEAAP